MSATISTTQQKSHKKRVSLPISSRSFPISDYEEEILKTTLKKPYTSEKNKRRLTTVSGQMDEWNRENDKTTWIDDKDILRYDKDQEIIEDDSDLPYPG